jgi:hypothetical protein
LNVAISRAKSECFLVASFEPTQLEVTTSRNQGPKLFKQFLEFAFLMHHGRRIEAKRVLDLVRQSGMSPHVRAARLPAEGFVPLGDQIAEALEAEGIPYERGVGESTFRVPVGVLDPADPTRFTLAIMADDGQDAASAFETHVHRRGVLAQRGWKVLHVSAAAWYRRRTEIVEEIVALVPGARGAYHSAAYAEHRAKRRKPVSLPPPPSAPAPRVAGRAAPRPVGDEPPAAPSVPAWALAIEDPKFRRALMHLEAHGSLGETELVNLVGGARRARAFALALDGWRDVLPFVVETTSTSGSKVYMNAGPRR